MDIPIFHMDLLNNRFLIGIIAAIHVVVNHAMAVGGIPMITFLEWYGEKKKDPRWDEFAHRTLRIFFITTTSLGALTGVGIWFSAALVNPQAIGSLIRVFFMAWFTEWIVFVIEVSLIMFYYLTWNSWRGERKKKHIMVGVALSISSWLTMVIIVAILGFMMDPGSWLSNRSFFSGVLNPAYLPQLAFRTPLAMIMAGAAALFFALITLRKDSEFRKQAVRALCLWQLAWSPLCFIGATWYANIIPEAMIPNLAVANATIHFERWYEVLKDIILVVIVGGAVLSIWGIWKPHLYPKVAYIIPILGLSFLLSHFERVREFIRKPFVIGNYLYSNSIRYDDYPLLQKEGILKHATYVTAREITPENSVQIGQELFMMTCSRCHTVNGINGIKSIMKKMYGDSPWNRDAVTLYLGTMHKSRPFMPPFPGNYRESVALADYLVFLQKNDDPAHGAQSIGVVVPKEKEEETVEASATNTD